MGLGKTMEGALNVGLEVGYHLVDHGKGYIPVRSVVLPLDEPAKRREAGKLCRSSHPPLSSMYGRGGHAPPGASNLSSTPLRSAGGRRPACRCKYRLLLCGAPAFAWCLGADIEVVHLVCVSCKDTERTAI
ncbi:MAG: hypothetical protein DUD39_15345 [Coriobacteriaceae bacterium]|nr:MAG: hypothetical protein DUD39_15345 [Coriobacteriaceae bacterium]